MTILVTGGTGYLGKHLVRQLVADGRSVRLLVRDERRAAGLPVDEIELVRGDLADPASLQAAAAGVEELIHAGALVKRWVRDRREFEHVNVAGTASLLRAAHAAGVQRMVYVSSFFALGCSDAGADGIADENQERDPAHVHTEYERSKHLAAVEVQRMAAEGLPVISVFPCVIYGPGELTEGNIVTTMLRDHLRGKLPGIPGDGERKWTYAFVADVVAGILAALRRGRVGERYILGGETATANEFFEEFQRISGRRPPRWHLPFPLLKVVAAIEELKARFLGFDPRFTRAEIDTYRHHWAYDCSRARRELDYRARPLCEGLETTYRWLIAEDSSLEASR